MRLTNFPLSNDALRRRTFDAPFKLLPDMEIKIPRPIGRPRLWPKDMPIAARYKGRRGRNRPTCLAKGCHKLLRMSQIGVCSDVCANAVFSRCMTQLRMAGITKQQILDYLNDDAQAKVA